jgi:hypothetical protein
MCSFDDSQHLIITVNHLTPNRIPVLVWGDCLIRRDW